MGASGCWSFLLISFLFFCLCHDPSLAFSLKNCTLDRFPSTASVKCRKRDLVAVPDDIPRDAESLDLSENYIPAITRTDFRGLSKLIYVLAGTNVISHIDEGAFADLQELYYLSLDENKLTHLTDHVFQGLSKLNSLYLDNNQISAIFPGAFHPLVSIRVVSLSSNQLHTITDIVSIFKLPNLDTLNIGKNSFTSFESDDLPLNVSNVSELKLEENPLRQFKIKKDIFPYLQSLDLCDCSSDMEWDVANKSFLGSLTDLTLCGSNISFETYRDMLQTAEYLQTVSLIHMKKWIDKGLIDVACQNPFLTSLYASTNDIGFIDDNLLILCSQLNNLYLRENNLSGMSEHALQNLTQVTFLDLSSNYLSKVPLTVRGLTTLETLRLSFNSISELSCLDFQNLTEIIVLSLNNNCISSLQECLFQNLNELVDLYLGGNSFLTLENTFRISLDSLRNLDLQDSRLRELFQGSFSGLSSLDNLDIETNQNSSFHDGVFEGLDNLRILGLSPGLTTIIPLKGLENLETLTIDLISDSDQYDQQQQKKPPFSNLANLITLKLTFYNELSSIIPPHFFYGLKYLQFLTIESLSQRSLHPDTFKHTLRLKTLQIVKSGLTHLSPEVFWPIPTLEELDLSNNNLQSLDFLAQSNLLVLHRLELMYNTLSNINETVFQSLPALTYLDLTGNTFTCECYNSGLNQWIQRNNQTLVNNAYQYTCGLPVSQQGNKLLDFDVSSCWIDTNFLCFISSTCLIVFTLLASFIYHFLRWYLTYAYYLFLAFLYDKKSKKKGALYNYDAFVSYNVHDEAWVFREMLPVLEGEQGWRLCLHHRDFEPGKPIIENITDAIYSSRKTICVISRNYLQSEWCSREIQIASFRLFDEHKDILILLFLEDIPAYQLSPYYRMSRLVKRCTYLSWPQACQHPGVFWNNVRRALEAPEKPTERTNLLNPNFLH